MVEKNAQKTWSDNDIAIVGMAAHLPGSDTLDTYWANLRDGVECITELSDADLTEAGESAARMRHKNYVASAAVLKDYEKFDADFFGLSPKEAAIMDPQHRKFLEVSWEALETAGHMPERFGGPIGVFAGCGMGSYFYFNVCSNRELVDSTGMFLLRHTGNDKDFLSTRLSHFLDLKGPSLSVQTACSTSLVATHYAVQSLLNGECDMALAGGVTIEFPHGRGYVYEDGEILSPDGHCHAFDHRAQGTVFGSGAGVVVLRRMADALADNDHIWGVIRATAVNNDGSDKAGYLAPSVDGQAGAIAEAHGLADISADTIDYVECHGTGTYLGDPIEVAALTEAFRETTDEAGFCRIGSVKTNIGHLDTAAGAASLIKTALSLHNKQLPPSLGYEAPNPAIDFDTSPFKVNDRLNDWVSHKGPRRAGVNSLGVGGTNAHVVVEEAPAEVASDEAEWPYHVLTLSGRSAKALDGNAARLAQHLRANPDVPLADVAYTLQEGRRAFEKRRVIVADSHEQAIALLENGDKARVFDHSADTDTPDVVFMFPGGGAQFAGMARDLYETEPVFQDWMDRGLEVLRAKVDYDPRAIWLAEGMSKAQADAKLTKPSVQLPLIMITEYALAQLWISWGVTPAALVGHSMGENTAACLAGVMSFEDCIGLVLLRGQLFDTVPAGGMLSVPLSVSELTPYLSQEIDIAARNAADLTVVSGPQKALDALQTRLSADEIEAQRVQIDIAAHSRMLEPILQDFHAYLSSITLNAPSMPIISNVTGQVLKAEDATSPDYWVGHLRGTVMFADCLSTASQITGRVYLEVGPGKALSSLARMHSDIPAARVLSSLRHPKEEIEDDKYFLEVLGRLWACGVSFDWTQIWGDARRNRVVLPTYAFQKASYFIAPSEVAAPTQQTLLRQDNIEDWGYRMAWKPALAECDPDLLADPSLSAPHSWLIFMDDTGVGRQMSDRLRAAGHSVTEVSTGDAFGRLAKDRYVLAPERGREGYDQLMADLIANGRAPDRVLHLWLLTDRETFRPGSSFFHRNLEMGFHALLYLSQAMVEENLPRPVHVMSVTNGTAKVGPEPLSYPEKSVIQGPLGVLPREVPGVSTMSIDVELADDLGERLFEDLLSDPSEGSVAYRGSKRFVQMSKPHALDQEGVTWRVGETYMITGGLGGIGATVAKDMLSAGANVVLQSRKPLPDRETWDKIKAFRATDDPLSRRVRLVEDLEKLPGKLMIVAADVCNLDDMQRAVRDVDARFGKINGVIHAAGVINDGPMLAKSSVDVADVMAPKLHGTLVLDQLFPDGALNWLVLFSSTSTVTTPAGQVDYVAANEFLNAYASARKGDVTQVMSVNWGVWADVGMAVESLGGDSTAKPQDRIITAPVLQRLRVMPGNEIVFTAEISAKTCWMLDQHRTWDGAAILPGTGYLELISEAMQALDETRAYEVRDLLFLRPFHVEDGQSRKLRISLRETDSGYDVEVLGSHEDGFVLHAEGRISMVALSMPQDLDIMELSARFDSVHEAPVGQTLTTRQEAHLNFGAHWKTLVSQSFHGNEGLACLRLDDAVLPAAKGMSLHPGLLDIGTGWAMDLIAGYQAEALWVPMSYGALRHFATLPAEIISHVTLVSGSVDEGTASFDVVLADLDGRVCVEVDGLAIKQLPIGGSLGATPPVRDQDIRRDQDHAPQALSPGEQRLADNIAEGIPAAQGAEALRRALATGLPRVVISSLDLEGLVAQSSQEFDDTAQSEGFERPDLDADFVAPETDVQRTLAGFWSDLLGIEQIGIHDSFFDLGGHSLVAVRLFAMVKKAYRVSFPISVLFEAPTIESCAALIEERIGPQDTSDSADIIPGPSAPERRYTHLVPMHGALQSDKTPFFLVAGMYGNVLNLRHLGHLIGSDRPFYGLQARGLFGDVAPHDSITRAARDYIDEMREVQPHGPYMLGGFSGGGITAYEIAHQLKAMGEEVSLVVMLDTPLPQRRPLSREDRIKIQLQELKSGGVGYLYRWAKNRIAWEIQKRRPHGETHADEGEAQFHNAEIEAAFLRAVSTYQVRPWSGRVALYRPPMVGKWQVAEDRLVDKDRAYVLADNDWGQFVADLSVLEVPGDHDSMVLEPNVRVLASHIRKAIEDAEEADQVIVPFRRAAG
ncbi:SDR family NAD(P)-dependent oxidoreductase [Cognatishimia sp.]|uniref:type I polyketide synthase n=1 Tax=Cognatishimia sp. TaxID=2211648 RepID=UPI0035131024